MACLLLAGRNGRGFPTRLAREVQRCARFWTNGYWRLARLDPRRCGIRMAGWRCTPGRPQHAGRGVAPGEPGSAGVAAQRGVLRVEAAQGEQGEQQGEAGAYRQGAAVELL